MTPSPDSGAGSRTVDVDGPTHYLDMGGPSDGPSVILVHGLGGSHLNWSAIGPSLSRHCRVKALDLVGHGLTPTGRRTPGIEGHRRLLGGFMEAVGAAPALLIGNSMGGLVAALQAATEPDTVAGLVLIDPALPTAHLGLVHPRVVANFLLCALPGVGEGYLSQRRRRTSAAQSVRRVLAICCVDPSRVRPDVVQAHVDLTERLDRARTDEAYLRSARSLSLLMANPATTMRTLDGVRQPTLLLHGQRDLLVPLSAARRMSSAHPGWRFEVAPDTGHVPMLETPRWTSEGIEDWLGREGSSAAARASTVGHALS